MKVTNSCLRCHERRLGGWYTSLLGMTYFLCDVCAAQINRKLTPADNVAADILVKE